MPVKKNEKVREQQILVSLKQGCRKLRGEINRKIIGARKRGINLVIYSVEFQDQYLVLYLKGKKIDKLKKFFRKGPQKLTLIEILHFQDSVGRLIAKIEGRINKLYKGRYKIELITQIMKEGEMETLVILLARRIK